MLSEVSRPRCVPSAVYFLEGVGRGWTPGQVVLGRDREMEWDTIGDADRRYDRRCRQTDRQAGRQTGRGE